MAYATKQQMIDRFGEVELVQLTNRTDPSATTIADAKLDAALQDASDEIDGYLAGRYSLPFESPPRVMVLLCSDIARWYLYDGHGTEKVKERYDNAIKFLTAVAKGSINLGTDEGGDVATSSDSPQADAPQRIFTRGNLSDYRGS